MAWGGGEVHFGFLLLLAEHFAFVALLLQLDRRSPLLSGTHPSSTQLLFSLLVPPPSRRGRGRTAPAVFQRGVGSS